MSDYRLCTDWTHVSGWQCARCNRTYCSSCDRMADKQFIKTLVRWCQDWRCQREEKIERGEDEVTKLARALGDIRVRLALTEAAQRLDEQDFDDSARLLRLLL